MKSTLNRLIIIALTLSLPFFTTNCQSGKRKGSKTIDKRFSNYIKAFPSKSISNESDLVIEFFENVRGIDNDQPADPKLFSISPEVKGELYWKDANTLVFNPAERLTPDTYYTIKLQLGKVMQVPSELKTFETVVHTHKQNISVAVEGLKVYTMDDLTRQKLTGVLTTSDGADASLVEQTLAATQKGNELTITWDHMGDGRSHHFTVEQIIRGNQKSDVILQWNGKPIGSADQNEETVEIPALGDFKVFDLSMAQQPEQCITVFFSDPLDQKQDLQGLVHLKNNAQLRLVIRESEIKIYPATRQIQPTELFIEQGVKNIMGYRLSEQFVRKIEFSNLKPDVQLLGNGVILPNSKGLVFPFKAVGLNAVNVKILKIFENNICQFLQTNQLNGTDELRRVGRIVFKKSVPLTSDKNIDYGEWNNFSLDLSKLIETEPGAIYRVYIGFDKSQSTYPCTSTDKTDEGFSTGLEDDPETAEFDEPGYYYYSDDYYDEYDDYNYSERDDPCKDSYYRNRTVSRNVLASDLGIIAKAGQTNEFVALVTNLVTAEPLSGVEVEYYNYQNQLIDKATTDDDGKVVIPLKAKPFLLVAKKDKQRGYLRLDDGSALSLSMFDISGQESKKGIKGFIYGERGVWRPGDSIYISFILEDKNHILPENHPVVMELYTPENQLYERKVKTTQLHNFYDFRTATKHDDPTGNWLVKVKVGNSVFTNYLKIETVKPNRIKINLDFGSQVLVKSESTNGTLELKWLHGAIAKNLKADVVLTLTKGNTLFIGYEDFTFSDPTKSFESQEISVFNGNVNEQGKATISAKINVGTNAPGMLSAKFKTRAFEEGGDFSTDIMKIKYSPFTSYVGVKIPEGKGWNGALFSNEPNLIPIVTLDENGNPVSRSKLKIEIFKLDWRWWWEYSDDYDLGHFVSSESQNLMKTDYVDTKEGKAIYEMKLNQESWGRKLIKITDPVSGHSTGMVFYTTYKGWWNSNQSDNPGGAEMLTFSTDKKSYNVGEKVMVDLPVTQNGKALVSLESGSKIIKTFWVDVAASNGKFNFETTSEMTPNVYIHISYIQPHNQMNNDLPIRMYGVQPVGVEDPETHLEPVITMPDVLEPEKEVTVKISEAHGKSMTYTLAVVDDGLLDLTRFATPNAWSTFYAREALGIKTWDLYKYVSGAFSGEMAGLLALGGDEELRQKGDKKADRFKPVVIYMGPYELKSGTNTHTFKMPNYIGSVRTMVVAGMDGAYGKTEKTTPVKKALMVQATLPRVMGPGEKVQLPVNVFAMDSKIKEVKIEVETNELFNIEGETKKQVNFAAEGDEVVYFNLNVNDKIGIGKVHVTATSGREKSTYDIELDVRVPNPRISQISEEFLEPGKSVTMNYQAIGIKGTNKGVVELSSMPSINLSDRLNYLIQYPHGCIEQTTSSVFPQLYLTNLMDLLPAQKEKIDKNIKAGIDRLRQFQQPNGGMSYWPGETDYVSDWGTCYAGHFMLEAQKAGYNLPVGFLNSWINYQTDQANNFSYRSASDSYYYENNYLTQAYRLYTLALAEKPAIGAMNRLKEVRNLPDAAEWRLAAAYYLAGREAVAKEMITNLTIDIKPYKELSYTYGSDIRDKAMILETLVLMKNTDKSKDLVTEIAKQLSSERWLSTQTTAYSLLSLAKFAAGLGKDNAMKYDISFNNGKNLSVNSDLTLSQQEIDLENTPNGSVTIKNKSQKSLFVKIQLSGIPSTGDASSASNDLTLKVQYLDLKGNVIDPVSLVQGTDFMAEVHIVHPGIRGDYKEMALTQIFPSGWEIRNLRMEESTSTLMKDTPRYMDIRDDRVYSYFDINTSSARTFRILLNAAYVGKFYLPTVYCEAMYDSDINGHVGGQWVEVVKQ